MAGPLQSQWQLKAGAIQLPTSCPLTSTLRKLGQTWMASLCQSDHLSSASICFRVVFTIWRCPKSWRYPGTIQSSDDFGIETHSFGVPLILGNLHVSTQYYFFVVGLMFWLIKFQFLMVDIHILDGECPVIKGYYQSSDQDGRHSPRIPSQKISTPPQKPWI